VFFNKVQIGVQHLTQTLQNAARRLRGGFQTALEFSRVFDHEIDEEIVFAFEIQVKGAYREVRTINYFLDPQRRKPLLVYQVVRRFQQPSPHLRIRSAKAATLTQGCPNSFDLLQLSFSFSMNVI
jgi:hypothetical protein